MKEQFLDSFPIWIKPERTNIWAKPTESVFTLHFVCLKRLSEKEHKEVAKNEKNCWFCEKPLLQQNFKYFVKDRAWSPNGQRCKRMAKNMNKYISFSLGGLHFTDFQHELSIRKP